MNNDDKTNRTACFLEVSDQEAHRTLLAFLETMRSGKPYEQCMQKAREVADPIIGKVKTFVGEVPHFQMEQKY